MALMNSNVMVIPSLSMVIQLEIIHSGWLIIKDLMWEGGTSQLMILIKYALTSFMLEETNSNAMGTQMKVTPRLLRIMVILQGNGNSGSILTILRLGIQCRISEKTLAIGRNSFMSTKMASKNTSAQVTSNNQTEEN